MGMIGLNDRCEVDVRVEREKLQYGRFIETVNWLGRQWDSEVRGRGMVPIEGQRVSFACVIEDLPLDMMVIRVTGDVRRI